MILADMAQIWVHGWFLPFAVALFFILRGLLKD